MLFVEFQQVQYIDFKWDSSCFESCGHCDFWTLKLINNFCGQSPFECHSVPWMDVEFGLWDPEKVSLSPE